MVAGALPRPVSSGTAARRWRSRCVLPEIEIEVHTKIVKNPEDAVVKTEVRCELLAETEDAAVNVGQVTAEDGGQHDSTTKAATEDAAMNVGRVTAEDGDQHHGMCGGNAEVIAHRPWLSRSRRKRTRTRSANRKKMEIRKNYMRGSRAFETQRGFTK